MRGFHTVSADLVFRLLAGVAVLTAMLIAGIYRRRATSGESFSVEEEGLAIAIPLRLGGRWLGCTCRP